MKTFKVRVTGSGSTVYWYTKEIGREFVVRDLGSTDPCYRLLDDPTERGIYRSDCVIVEDFKVGDRGVG